MRVFILLASYRPPARDQVAYAYRLGKGLGKAGHEVTLLISESERPSSVEAQEGVRVVVAPTLLRLGTFACLPKLGFLAARLTGEHDVVNVHLPGWGAVCSAMASRATRTPLVLTHHRDLRPPGGWFNGLAGAAVGLGSWAARIVAERVVCSTEDFAESSSFLQSAGEKIEVIPPPVEVAEIGEGAVAAFRKMHRLDEGGPVIGMTARLAAESGVEVLLNALPRLVERYPQARVLFAGQFLDVMGEETYAQRLAPVFRQFEDHWTFLGLLRPVQLAAFYPNLDVLVAPSLEPVDSFGLAQAEAMVCGTPSIASDLPGIRQPVKQSGMGKLVPVGDSEALAEAIIEVIGRRQEYVRPREEIEERWSTERTVRRYESLFQALLADQGASPSPRPTDPAPRGQQESDD